MIKYAAEDKEYLSKYIDKNILEGDDIGDVLLAINDLILAGLSKDQQYLTERGRKAQDIYDRVYDMN